ncbi:hypothetical protein D3C74_452200 [compost metagenome]
MPRYALRPLPNRVMASPDIVWFARSVTQRNECIIPSTAVTAIAASSASSRLPLRI